MQLILRKGIQKYKIFSLCPAVYGRKVNVTFHYYSAQRHNKLFRSRSESSLSEPSVNEDSSRVPHIHVDDPGYGVTMHDFDLNRRLLDLTSAGAPKVSD